MREIKFRAWDNHNKIWLDTELFNIVCNTGKLQRNGSAGFIGGVDILQYTGLKDKNGVEIYEGDIVKYEYGQIFEIKWDYGLLSHLENIWFKIIGNIYENPELTEEKPND